MEKCPNNASRILPIFGDKNGKVKLHFNALGKYLTNKIILFSIWTDSRHHFVSQDYVPDIGKSLGICFDTFSNKHFILTVLQSNHVCSRKWCNLNFLNYFNAQVSPNLLLIM